MGRLKGVKTGPHTKRREVRIPLHGSLSLQAHGALQAMRSADLVPNTGRLLDTLIIDEYQRRKTAGDIKPLDLGENHLHVE